MLPTVIWTQHSNTYPLPVSKTLETQSGSDQMSGILLMRTSDQFHNTELKIHQSTNSRQENLVRALISSQVAQVELKHLLRHVETRRLPQPPHQCTPQRKLQSCSQWSTSTEPTPTPQTWGLLSMLNNNECGEIKQETCILLKSSDICI